LTRYEGGFLDIEVVSPVRNRWSIGYVMILIGLLAVGFATVGIAGTTLLGIIGLPAWLAPRGKRLSRLYWVLAFYPCFVVLWLYVVWFNGWVALGHPPRSSLDDPKDIPQIQLTYFLMGMLFYCFPFFLFSALGLAVFRSPRRVWPWLGRLLLVPSAYGWSYAILRWDPFWVLDWFFD
jgi:hypothetical protein